MITIHVSTEGRPTSVTYRAGTSWYNEERDALAFVARRLADRPDLKVEIRVD